MSGEPTPPGELAPRRACGCPDCACPIPIVPRAPDTGEERCSACTKSCRVPPFALGVPAWVLASAAFWAAIALIWRLAFACDAPLS